MLQKPKLGEYVYFAGVRLDTKSYRSFPDNFDGIDMNQGLLIAIHEDMATIELNSLFYKTKCLPLKDCFESREAAYRHFFGV